MNSSSWIPKDSVFCNLIGDRVTLNKLSLSFRMSTQSYENWERLFFLVLLKLHHSLTLSAQSQLGPDSSISKSFRSGWPGNSGLAPCMRMPSGGDPDCFWKLRGKRCLPAEACIRGEDTFTACTKGSRCRAASLPLSKGQPRVSRLTPSAPWLTQIRVNPTPFKTAGDSWGPECCSPCLHTLHHLPASSRLLARPPQGGKPPFFPPCQRVPGRRHSRCHFNV